MNLKQKTNNMNIFNKIDKDWEAMQNAFKGKKEVEVKHEHEEDCVCLACVRERNDSYDGSAEQYLDDNQRDEIRAMVERDHQN